MPYQAAGVVLALDTNNYAKFTLGLGDSGSKLEFSVENNASFASAAQDIAFNLSQIDNASEGLDLWLVRRANGTIEALYRQVTNLTGAPVFGPILSAGATSSAPPWILSSAQLYGALYTTDFGAGGSIDTYFDEFELGPPVTEAGHLRPSPSRRRSLRNKGPTSGSALGISGFDNPTSLALGPGLNGRLFVATQGGKIYVLTLDYTTLTDAERRFCRARPDARQHLRQTDTDLQSGRHPEQLCTSSPALPQAGR